MPGIRVLIAEKDHPLAVTIGGLLENSGYQVVGIATTIEEAVSLSSEVHPSVILLDVRLILEPEGLHAAEMIQSQLDIPIIYVTSQAGEHTLRRSRKTGPFAYLFKPFDSGSLITTIEMTLARHSFEQKILESEQWQKTILNSIQDGVIVVDSQGLITDINPAAQKIIGMNSTEAIYRPISDVFMVVEESSHAPVNMTAFMTQDQPQIQDWNTQYALKSQAGKLIPVEITPAPIVDPRDRLQGMAIVFRDITERRRVEQEIQRQASRSEALVRVASRLNSHLDLDRVLALVCEEAARALDAPITYVILFDRRKNFFDLAANYSRNRLFEQHRQQFEPVERELYEKFLRKGSQSVSEISDIQELGEVPNSAFSRNMNIRSMVIASMCQKNEIIGTLNAVTIGNIRHFTQDEILFLKGLADQSVTAILNASLFSQVSLGRERLKTLSKKLVEIQEFEKRSLARELHDQIGQMLTGLQLSLEANKRLSGEELRESLGQSQSIVLTLMGQIRELSLRLRPTMLDDMGLLPTLIWYLSKIDTDLGMAVDFYHSGMEKRLKPELETAVYRIIQEALTNAARYSMASQIKVACVVKNGILKIQIQDNGKGFDFEQVMSNRTTFGLIGMHERANLLGGELTISSTANKGTRVSAVFPLDRPLERRNNERIGLTGR